MTTVDPQVIRRTNATLTGGTWFLILGVVVFSLMTTTPFVAQHSAWRQAAPLLGLMTDAAFVMALQADSVLARYGVAEPGGWPRAFRWFTGLATVFLNVWESVQAQDWTGVAVHLVGPALLLIVAEVAPVYRRAMAEALRRAESAKVDTLGGQVDGPAAHLVVSTPSTLPAPAAPVAQAAQVKPVCTPVAQVDAPAAQVDAPNAQEGTTAAQPDALSGVVDTLGAHLVDTPADKVDALEAVRLSTPEARKVIERAWRDGVSTREAARLSTRSASYVGKVFSALDATKGPRPVAGQLALVK